MNEMVDLLLGIFWMLYFGGMCAAIIWWDRQRALEEQSCKDYRVGERTMEDSEGSLTYEKN